MGFYLCVEQCPEGALNLILYPDKPLYMDSSEIGLTRRKQIHAVSVHFVENNLARNISEYL